MKTTNVDKKAKEASKTIALEKRVRDLESSWYIWIVMVLVTLNIVLIWAVLSSHKNAIVQQRSINEMIDEVLQNHKEVITNIINR